MNATGESSVDPVVAKIGDIIVVVFVDNIEDVESLSIVFSLFANFWRLFSSKKTTKKIQILFV